ncbi:MAG TPA: VOC family protein [Candidatus Baltobacteraceae bacterium]
MTVKLGVVGHFGLAVRDPKSSAAWWCERFDLKELFAFEEGVAIGNDAVTIALHAGVPHPGTLDHMSFHVADRAALERALSELRTGGVKLEDPGDEIGPEAPGSPNVGLWFHDPDGYRWELSVQV